MTDSPSPGAARREGVPALPVRLSDGRHWGFATPTRLLCPKVIREIDALGRPVDRVGVAVDFGYPLAIRRLLDRVKGTCEGGTVAEQYEAFFALATALLLRAQDLELAVACELLRVAENDLPRLVREVLAIATRGPGHPGVDTGP